MNKAQCDRRAAALMKRRRTAASGILKYRFGVGKLMIDLIESKRRNRTNHGLGSVDELAESLGDHSGRVFESIRLMRALTDDDRAFFEQNAWPYSLVVELSKSSRKVINLIKRKYVMMTKFVNIWEMADEIKKLRKEHKPGAGGKSKKKKKKKK